MLTNNCVFAIVVNLLTVISTEKFQLEFQWSLINYTWQSSAQYQEAVRTGTYKPDNIFPTGPKLYRDRIYLATPNLQGGVPLTLAYIPRSAKNRTNIPLVPFPSWNFHGGNNCSNIQNVQAVEISPDGILWVLDGIRLSTIKCPPKLLQFDLNKGGILIHSYVFPNDVCLHDGGYLNDLVLDGDFAYITDSSSKDPGLVVYSRSKNRSWKLRDASMLAEKPADEHYALKIIPGTIDGIALSPFEESKIGRIVFYSCLNGYNLTAVPADVLKEEAYHKNDTWRASITHVGRKQGTTDGMMMDNRGNLYYSLTSKNAVGKWNIHQAFNRDSKVIYQSNLMVWPDAFGMDQEGYLYVISNYFLDKTRTIKFRIFKTHTGTKSYQYR
ncbi:hypothetical protein JTB14_006224 [Gonioctena quinquepunctata]|nr:hypothetical protein JTB14_006224 [Gonioctena quinquepunctata]